MGEFAELSIERDLESHLTNIWNNNYCNNFDESKVSSSLLYGKEPYWLSSTDKIPYYEKYKEGETIIIKKIGKIFPIAATIVKITEKAILFKVESVGNNDLSSKNYKFWAPKAALIIRLSKVEKNTIYMESWATINTNNI